MKYEFILMYYGDEIGRQIFDKYDSARKFFYHEYVRYDRGCRIFIDDKEIKLFDAYKYFNLSPLVFDYIWHKDPEYRRGI